MVELGVAAMVVLIVVLAVIRFARRDSIERSISGHHRRLGSIEDVVQRSAERRGTGAPSSRRAEEAPPEPPPTVRAETDLPAEEPRRAEIDVPEDRPVSREGRLVFGDLSVTPVKPPVPPIYESRRPPRRDRSGRHFRPGGAASRPRRVWYVGALIGVVVVAALVGAVTLAHRPSAAPPVTTTTSPAVTTTTTTVAVQGLRRLSSTPTSSTFAAPAGTYHVTFAASRPCWLGFKHSSSASVWLATPTIGVAGHKSFSMSTKGSLYIVIGAPAALTDVRVNGTALHLPALPTRAYNLVLQA